jgi:hypothetical protein
MKAILHLLTEIRDILLTQQSEITFLSIPQAAREVGVDKEYIREEMENGKLKFCLWGKGESENRRKERKTTRRWIREWQESFEQTKQFDEYADKFVSDVMEKISLEHTGANILKTKVGVK